MPFQNKNSLPLAQHRSPFFRTCILFTFWSFGAFVAFVVSLPSLNRLGSLVMIQSHQQSSALPAMPSRSQPWSFPYETGWEAAAGRGVGQSKHVDAENAIRARGADKAKASFCNTPQIELSCLQPLLRPVLHPKVELGGRGGGWGGGRGRVLLKSNRCCVWRFDGTLSPLSRVIKNLSQHPAWRSPLFWGLGRIKTGCRPPKVFGQFDPFL